MNVLDDLKRGFAELGVQDKPAPWPRVSNLMKCARQQTLLRALGTFSADDPKSRSWQSVLATEQGNWVEDGVVAILNRSGYTVRDQQRELYWPTKEEPMLSGHIDGILEKPLGAITSEAHLFECKATSAYRFAQFYKNGLTEEPGYVAQVQCYMHMLRDEGEDISSAFVVLVAKDPSSLGMQFRGKESPDPVIVYEIEYSPEAARSYLNRAEQLFEWFEEGKLGPRERKPKMGNSGDWDCSERWCPVFHQCNPFEKENN